MSTIFTNPKGEVVWEHHETFTPQVGTIYQQDGWVFKVDAVELRVIEDTSGPMVFKQLKSFVKLV